MGLDPVLWGFRKDKGCSAYILFDVCGERSSNNTTTAAIGPPAACHRGTRYDYAADQLCQARFAFRRAAENSQRRDGPWAWADQVGPGLGNEYAVRAPTSQGMIDILSFYPSMPHRCVLF
jgi:hypothetical protein